MLATFLDEPHRDLVPAVYGTRNFDARALIWATGTRNASATFARLWSTVISDAPRSRASRTSAASTSITPASSTSWNWTVGRLLQLDEHVETAPAALPPARVATSR